MVCQKFKELVGTCIKCTIIAFEVNPLYGSNILLYLCYRAYNTSVIVCLFLLVLVVQH